MALGKYKYYFRKPKSEIVKDVIKILLMSGTIIIAAQSPYFIRNILKNHKNWSKYPKKKLGDTFSNLRKQGFIEILNKGGQIYIQLTNEGKKRAGMYQISSLNIRKPKKWDGKWRVVIFDIAELKRIHREAFRGKIKELGFHCLQKSVWIHPYDCHSEIGLLRDFFGLSHDELRLIIAEGIEEDVKLRKHFNLI